MKRQKNISDLFRDNQHKLNERPSSDAWDRLERKLDRHQTSARPQVRPMYRQLIMAASILFLVGMVSFFSFFLKQEKASFSEMQKVPSLTPVPTDFEDITYTDANDGLYKMVNYSKNLNTNPRKVIQEGAPYKKLVAQRTTKLNGAPSNIQYAQVEKVRKNKNAKAEVEESIVMENSAAAAKHSDTNDGIIAMKDESNADDKIIESPSKPVVASAPTTYSDADIAFEESAEIVSTSSAEAQKRVDAAKDATPKAKTSRATKKQESTARAQDITLNAMKNSIEVSANSPQLGLDQFKWILGNWKNQSPIGQSYEAWKQLDEFNIQGKGFLVVNGDTTFTEGMNIQKIDQDLYYILAVDQQGVPVKYKLKTYTEKQVVFENNAIAFPNQVILQRADAKNFKTVLQNSQAPTQLNASQNVYLQNRNQIHPEQVERVMTKTDR